VFTSVVLVYPGQVEEGSFFMRCFLKSEILCGVMPCHLVVDFEVFFLCLLLQMFIVDQANGNSCSLKEFTISGSTYAPDGQV